MTENTPQARPLHLLTPDPVFAEIGGHGNAGEGVAMMAIPFGRKSQKLMNLQQPIIMSYESAATTDELAQKDWPTFQGCGLFFCSLAPQQGKRFATGTCSLRAPRWRTSPNGGSLHRPSKVDEK